MSYRRAYDRDESDEAFEDFRVGFSFENQFTEDSHGPIFYRHGIGRPVRVTAQERRDAFDLWDLRKAYIDQATVALGISLLALLFILGPETLRFLWALFGGVMGLLLANFAARRMLATHLTREFRSRTPAGAERSRWDHYRAVAAAVGWKGLAGGVAVLAINAGGRLSFKHQPFDWLLAGIDLLAASGVIVLIIAKLLNWRAHRQR